MQYGRVLTKSWQIVVYCCLFFSVLVPLIFLIVFILSLVERYIWNSEDIFLLLLGMLLFFSFSMVCILIIRNSNRIKRKIMLWEKDAVITKAYSEKIDEVRLGIQQKQVKIKVEFIINGQKYSRVSAGKMIGGGPEGYHKIWAYYADREINIMYSPRYDQVLILKD